MSAKITFILIAILFVSVYLKQINASNNQMKQRPKKIDNFTLKDINGKPHSLNDFKNKKAIVLVFISTECPVSNGYNKRMMEINKFFSNKDVEFIGINSNKQETIEDIKKHADDHKFDFLILKDSDNIVANKLGASVTPEAYVLNSNFQILYHGRIDDSRRDEDVKSQDLKNAISSVLKGERIQNSETKAFGCTIKKVD